MIALVHPLDTAAQVADLLDQACAHHGQGRLMQPTALVVTLLDQLLAALDQHAQLLTQGIGNRRGRLHQLSHARQQGRIQRIGLGGCAQGRGESACPARIDPGHRDPCRGQCRHHRPFVAAGGLQQRVADAVPGKVVAQALVALGGIGKGQQLVQGKHVDGQGVLGHIDTDPKRHKR
nr:hypothetical protein [Xanthomonas translucens]